MNLRQLIQEPTHLLRYIDHIYMSRNGSDCSAVGIGPPIEKNHALTWIRLKKISVSRGPKISCEVWDWKDADWNRARALLTLWEHNGAERNLVEEIENQHISVDDAANHLTAELRQLQSLVVPHKMVWFRHNSCPWMDKSLLRHFQRRNQAFRQWKTSGTPNARKKWIRLKKTVKSRCKGAKKLFVKDNFDKAKTKAEFWKCVRKLENPEHMDRLSDVKLRDGSFVTGGEAANAFSAEFAQNFNYGDDENAHVYLDRNINADWFCDDADVLMWINKLKNDAAVGCDGLSPRFLKACAVEIAPALSALLNRCLLEGKFPAVWKQAIITPIPKIPGTDCVHEFRPISVLPVLSKVAEMWMKEKLAPYIVDTINENQFAYAKGRSTEDAINLLQYYVTCGFNACRNVSRVAVISFDVKKAFDQVQHNKLLLVLRRQFWVPDILAELLDNYLSNRVQCVSVGGSTSEPCPVVSGVPQGSILGPHLFNAYISSVLELKLSFGSKLIAFADDLILVRPVTRPSDCDELQMDIDKIHSEYNKLGLVLNPAKSSYMVATLSPGPANVDLPVPPTLDGTLILRRESLKYLGVCFDPKLSFGLHVEEKTTKGKRAIGVLWRVLGRWTSREHFLELYEKQIVPQFCYALPVACPTDKKHWLMLEKCHRFATRLATNDYQTGYCELLERVTLKPVARMCVERQLLLMFKYLEGLRYLPANILQPSAQPTRQLRRNGRRHGRELQLTYDCFIAPVFRPPMRATLDQLPLAYAVYVWNSLPQEMIELTAPELVNFKRLAHDKILFQALERRQIQERKAIPTLMRYYSDL